MVYVHFCSSGVVYYRYICVSGILLRLGLSTCPSVVHPIVVVQLYFYFFFHIRLTRVPYTNILLRFYD